MTEQLPSMGPFIVGAAACLHCCANRFAPGPVPELCYSDFRTVRRNARTTL